MSAEMSPEISPKLSPKTPRNASKTSSQTVGSVMELKKVRAGEFNAKHDDLMLTNDDYVLNMMIYY